MRKSGRVRSGRQRALEFGRAGRMVGHSTEERQRADRRSPKKYVREVNRKGETVWEFTSADAPDYKLSNLHRTKRSSERCVHGRLPRTSDHRRRFNFWMSEAPALLWQASSHNQTDDY